MSITPISNDVLFGQGKSSLYDIFRLWHHLLCIIISLIREDEQMLRLYLVKRITLCEKCPNTEFFWSVFSCIYFKYRKIWTRKTSIFGHFSRNVNRRLTKNWKIILDNMKSPIRKIATRMILIGQFLLPGKLPPKKIPTQANFHPKNYHPR